MAEPHTLEELWAWTRRRLAEGQGRGLDDELVALGEAAGGDPPHDPAARWAWSAFQQAGPDERRRLAQLFIQAVGHGEFAAD
ncbi:MAG: hypothetical protein K6U14_01245 [Firmicutes bacterium]|nr:hypothetical protein [Alicyclobacillaceae bacterium]MCL6496244.1 hypothetical protein [Bacillota bacterium]